MIQDSDSAASLLLLFQFHLASLYILPLIVMLLESKDSVKLLTKCTDRFILIPVIYLKCISHNDGVELL